MYKFDRKNIELFRRSTDEKWKSIMYKVCVPFVLSHLSSLKGAELEIVKRHDEIDSLNELQDVMPISKFSPGVSKIHLKNKKEASLIPFIEFMEKQLEDASYLCSKMRGFDDEKKTILALRAMSELSRYISVNSDEYLQYFEKGWLGEYKASMLFVNKKLSPRDVAWWTCFNCCLEQCLFFTAQIVRESYPDMPLFLCSTEKHFFLSNTSDVDIVTDLCSPNNFDIEEHSPSSSMFTKDVSHPIIFDMIQQVLIENDSAILGYYEGEITITRLEDAITRFAEEATEKQDMPDALKSLIMEYANYIEL